MGGAVLIYLAAMVGVPAELYEAAEIDGAGICGGGSGTSCCRSCAR